MWYRHLEVREEIAQKVCMNFAEPYMIFFLNQLSWQPFPGITRSLGSFFSNTSILTEREYMNEY